MQIPPAPTQIGDINALRHAINAALREGWSVNAATQDDANGVPTIVLYPRGFEISDGVFTTPGITLDPDLRIETQVILDDISIPDYYVDGWDLANMLNGSTDPVEAAGSVVYESGITVADAHIENVKDVYVEVEMQVTVDIDVSLEDLGLDRPESLRFSSVEEAVSEVGAALTTYVADAFVVSERDVSIDLGPEDIGL